MHRFLKNLPFLLFSAWPHCLPAKENIEVTLNQLKAKLYQSKHDTQRVNVLNEITSTYWLMYQQPIEVRDSQSYYANKALQLSRQIHYRKGIAESLFNIGKYHITITRKFTEATPRLLESMAIFDELKDSAGISKCYLQLGVISFSMQYYEDAIRKNQLSLAYHPNETSKYLMAISYAELDSIPQATSNFHEAIAACKKIGKSGRLNECYMYLGKMYVHAGQLDSGFYYLRMAMDGIRQAGDTSMFSRPYAFIARAYLMNKRIDSALYYATRAYNGSAHTYDELTNLESLHTLSRAYAEKGDIPKAYHYLNLLADLKDSVYKVGIQQKVANMQSKFDYEKLLNAQKSKREKEQLLLDQQIQRGRIVRNSLIAGALMLLVLLGVLFNRFKLKRKANEELEEKNRQIMAEKERSDLLLLNILPSEVAEELKRTGEAVARQYNHVTVLFTDFVNFTGESEQMNPTELVQEIHKNFTAFDAIIEEHGLEKIKTIGDAYLAVCGMPNELPDHGIRVINAALAILEYIRNSHGKFKIRIGVHSGPVVAGIVGVKKYAYDIWGDTVNTASRMESSSEPGKINISGATYALVQDHFRCFYRGKIQAKNKGGVDMYFIEGPFANATKG